MIIGFVTGSIRWALGKDLKPQFSILWLGALTTAIAFSVMGISHGMLAGYATTLIGFGFFSGFYASIEYECDSQEKTLFVIIFAMTFVGSIYLIVLGIYTWFEPVPLQENAFAIFLLVGVLPYSIFPSLFLCVPMPMLIAIAIEIYGFIFPRSKRNNPG